MYAEIIRVYSLPMARLFANWLHGVAQLADPSTGNIQGCEWGWAATATLEVACHRSDTPVPPGQGMVHFRTTVV
mgnify:CR=1 FL=1